ncbi:MAG TPA: TetR/AcrR family transcriptional regulator [Solirubrobacteraceae bacterium]
MSASRDRRKAAPQASPLRPGHNGTAGSPGREYAREQVVEIQRARMLAAMVEVCDERGVGNVTVAHVVARAGTSRRTFYELYRDREDCFLDAFEHAVERAAAAVVPAYKAREAWRERIRAALAALLGFLDDEPRLGRLLVVHALGAGPRALERRARVLDALIDAVDRGRRDAPRRRDAPKRGDASRQGQNAGARPTLTAEGSVGAVFAVIHARLLDRDADRDGRSSSGRERIASPATPLSSLLNQLTSMIVLPYLGVSAARRELERPQPRAREGSSPPRPNPLRELDMRLTYRTVLVLVSIAEHPGASNRRIGEHAGVHDQGQISKLLGRLHRLGLIDNTGEGHTKGGPNEWVLTSTGRDVQRAIGARIAP